MKNAPLLLLLFVLFSCQKRSQDEGIKEIIGEYDGSCIEVKWRLDDATGVYMSDSVLFDCNIYITNAWLDRITIEGDKSEKLSGVNKRIDDTLV